MSEKKEANVITKSEWNWFRRDQQSGHMNMFGHPLIEKFMMGDDYSKAQEWFEVEGNDEPLTIERD